MRSYILLAGFTFISVLTMAQGGKLIAEKAGKSAVIIHQVQPKEGLYSLSRMYGVKVADIAAINNFDKDKSLSIGQKVKIPVTGENLLQKKGKTPVYYNATDGEKLSSISNRFNKVPLKDLKSWNKLNDDVIGKGKEIVVGYFNGEATTDNATQKTSDKETIKATAKGAAIISGTNINIRKGPATDQPVIATAQQGDEVIVLKKINSDWVAIRLNNGTEGYVASQFLQTGATAKVEQKKPIDLKTATVYGQNINIRKGPATDQPVITTTGQDEVVTILKKVNNDWTAVRLADGTEGYVAARFFQPPVAKPSNNVVAEVKTARIAGTNINVRKGPATDQPVVGIAQQDDMVTVIKNIDSEWSQVKLGDGTEGFIATRFLTTGNNNEQVASARNEQIDHVVDKIEQKVSKKDEAQATAQNSTESFESTYLERTNPDLVSEKTVTSGVFKTDRGWNDDRYYMLMDGAAPGTIVKITNPDNNKSVYAKVLGKMKGIRYSDGFDIRISEAAAQKLQADNTDKFIVKVNY